MHAVPLYVLAVLTARDASAVLYGGNPTLDFHVQRLSADLVAGSGHLNKVRIHECDSMGYQDYLVGQDIDPVVGFSLAIDGGDLCGATLYWADDVILSGADFVLAYTDTTTNVVFASPIDPVALTPIEVVSGSPGGVAPRLYVTVE